MKGDKSLIHRHGVPELFPASMAGASVQSVELSVFADQRSRANTDTGHGEMAEEAITLLDHLHGLDAEVTGRDNLKDGPDRRVGNLYIQTKYHNSARESLEACFDEKTGLYRYLRNGEPIQLEVPADQYDRVVSLFEDKIEAGLVPGVSDPALAADIVRPGRLTYQQAVDLTRPFTPESLAYDAATGALVSACAMGISFLAAGLSALVRTKSVKQACRAGASAGAQGLIRTFAQHLLISQFARTDLAAATLPAAQAAIDLLPRSAIDTAASILRSLTGKTPITGATAERQLARMLRTGLLSSGLILILLTLPDVFRLAGRRISAGQFAKNLLCRLASLTGGTLGALGAGMLLGTAASPVLGTLIAMSGAFLGGTALAGGVSALCSLFREDDFTRDVRQLNDTAARMCAEYCVTAAESAALSARFRRMTTKELRRMLLRVRRDKNPEEARRALLKPYFADIMTKRPTPVSPALMLEVPDIG